MPAIAPALEGLSIDITQEIHVRSSLEATFDALLEEMGPANQGHNGTPMPMTLEAWPGGRWFRDLGDGNGHLWGHVQAIKKPTLLEITGPLMMSFAVASNVQYRLTPEGRRHAHHAASHRARPLPRRLPRGVDAGLPARARPREAAARAGVSRTTLKETPR